eukprot:317347-Prorocentrum_minimum.AAC.2
MIIFSYSYTTGANIVQIPCARAFDVSQGRRAEAQTLNERLDIAVVAGEPAAIIHYRALPRSSHEAVGGRAARLDPSIRDPVTMIIFQKHHCPCAIQTFVGIIAPHQSTHRPVPTTHYLLADAHHAVSEDSDGDSTLMKGLLSTGSKYPGKSTQSRSSDTHCECHADTGTAV